MSIPLTGQTQIPVGYGVNKLVGGNFTEIGEAAWEVTKGALKKD
jgi:hypothetical protein